MTITDRAILDHVGCVVARWRRSGEVVLLYAAKAAGRGQVATAARPTDVDRKR